MNSMTRCISSSLSYPVLFISPFLARVCLGAIAIGAYPPLVVRKGMKSISARGALLKSERHNSETSDVWYTNRHANGLIFEYIV